MNEFEADEEESDEDEEQWYERNEHLCWRFDWTDGVLAASAGVSLCGILSTQFDLVVDCTNRECIISKLNTKIRLSVHRTRATRGIGGNIRSSRIKRPVVGQHCAVDQLVEGNKCHKLETQIHVENTSSESSR